MCVRACECIVEIAALVWVTLTRFACECDLKKKFKYIGKQAHKHPSSFTASQSVVILWLIQTNLPYRIIEYTELVLCACIVRGHSHSIFCMMQTIYGRKYHRRLISIHTIVSPPLKPFDMFKCVDYNGNDLIEMAI